MSASKSSPTKSKRKYPSGAQKRKLRAQREAALADARSELADRWLFAASGPRALTGDAYEELPVLGVPPPKLVGAVEGILCSLEQGTFVAAAQLADSMLRDDRIRGTLDVRIGGLLGCRLDLEPAMDTQRARSIKEDAEEQLVEMLPLAQVGELLRWGVLLGVGVAQVIYERDGRTWRPTIKVWHPRFLRWDWTDRKYKLITENAGEITIEPGDPQWVIFEPYGPRGWLRGLMRSIAMPWLIRSWTRSWWARHAEVHGTPIRLGIIPETRDPADEKRFLSQLSNLAHEAAIRLPQGMEGNKFDVRLLEAQANTFQGFQALLLHCDDSIAIAVLGQRSSTSGSTGLGSDANPGDAVRLDVKRADALIGDCLRTQVLCAWALWNYGSDELAPYIRWQVDPPEDLAKKAQELSTLADALQKMRAAGMPIDSRAILESFNVPLLDEAEAPPDVPGAPDPLPESPDDQDDEADDAPEPEDKQLPKETKPLSKNDLERARSVAEKYAAGDPQYQAPPDTKQLSARMEKLSEAAKEGDAYSLALASNAKRIAARALGPDLAKVKEVIEASTSPADLRHRLKVAFADMDPAELADVTHKALVLGRLAGRAMVHQEVKRK